MHSRLARASLLRENSDRLIVEAVQHRNGWTAMASDVEFHSLVERLHADEGGASEAVHVRFVGPLLALASRQYAHLALKAADSDPEDAVQSAFRTFFARARRGEFRFAGWGALWAVLALITRRKCLNRRDYLRAAKRSKESAGAPAAIAAAARDRAPTPLESSMLAETLTALLGRLNPSERLIIELMLEGFEPQAIALRLGRSERSVRRIQQWAELDLKDLLEAG